MWHELLVAVSLMLVIEGLLPFLSPSGFKETLLMISQSDDGVIRYGGLISMLVGVAMLYLVN
jgi:uncharacterized protein YjeT (DUF2065 family)